MMAARRPQARIADWRVNPRGGRRWGGTASDLRGQVQEETCKKLRSAAQLVNDDDDTCGSNLFGASLVSAVGRGYGRPRFT